MSLRVDRNLVLSGIIISLLVFVGHYGLPEKRLTLFPSKIHTPYLYGFPDAEVGQSSYWVDEGHEEWICHYREHHQYGCGWNLYWESADVNSINMRPYEHVDISLDYEGTATRIRFFLRNYNAAYSEAGNPASTKFMSMTIPVGELERTVRVSMNEIHVASWWLQERAIGRQWSLPEFDKITSIGVDFIEPGIHKTRVNKIVLTGRWIKTQTLLLMLVGFWMAVILTDGAVRLIRRYATMQRERDLIFSLETKQKKLEAEKRDLKVLANTDPLTGVFNRTGLQTQISLLFNEYSNHNDPGLLLIDIDHFKQLNTTYGHDMGDKVLRAFAAAMSANLRSEDVFARWDGEEFVVLCQNKSEPDLIAFAEKLRTITAQYIFGSSFELSITISIGITVARTEDGFDEAFKRAVKALKRAKKNGRNRVEFEL